MSQLFTPPRYFQNVIFHRHTDRAVGWLELFYDLVYVATLIQIGNFLSDNLTLVGFGQFLVLMTVVWWAWSAETFYQNRFVADDIYHRFLVFTQIFGVAVLGLSVSEAFGDLYVQFTLAYVLIRSIMVVMYVRAYFAHPESRLFSIRYIMGFSAGILAWLGSLLLPAEYHWVGWLVAIALEIVLFALPALRVQLEEWGPDTHHMVERFGIFTIIVLGESFVKILDDAQGTQVGMEQLFFSAGGLTVLYSLWWLYFSDTADHIFDYLSSLKPVAWIYGHLVLAAALVAFGVGAKKLYAETIDHPGDPVTEEYRLLYAIAVAIYLVALALIDYGIDDDSTPHSQIMNALIHLVSAIAVLGIGLLATGVTATQFVALIALIMAAQVVYSIYQSVTLREDEPVVS